VFLVGIALKRLVVVGSRGKIAAELYRHALQQGIRCALFSRAGGKDISPIDDLFTPGVWTGGDTFVHAAWSTVPFTSEQNPGVEWQVDIPLMVRIIKFLGALPSTGRPHFCFLSSGGTVYGDAPEKPSVETDALYPKGWHGLAKKGAEEIVEALCRHLEVPASILRISNPYGFPVSSVKPQGIIQHALRAAIEGNNLKLWGDGSAIKDFIFSQDLSITMLALFRHRITGIFNVAFGESASVSRVIELVEKVTRKRVNLTSEPPFAWDVQQSRLDITKLRDVTDYQPRVALEEGILVTYKAMNRSVASL
jgi:UDP-glucose 4-epimerase